MDSQPFIPRSNTAEHRWTVLTLVGDATLQRALTELCQGCQACRHVACDQVSDLVMNAFGIVPDLAVLEGGLIEDFSEALVHQIRQASPQIEILVYGPGPRTSTDELQRRGVWVTTATAVPERVAAFLQRNPDLHFQPSSHPSTTHGR